MSARFARLADCISRATGVTLDPIASQPGVVGDRLAFFAPVADVATIVEAFVGRYGVDPSGIAPILWLDADAFEVDSYVGATDGLISISLASLESRLAIVAAEVAS